MLKIGDDNRAATGAFLEQHVALVILQFIIYFALRIVL